MFSAPVLMNELKRMRAT